MKVSYPFPPGFLWGAATSSHQVEGDNRWNDWWAFEQSGRLPYRSGEACRHYHLYERDFDLARALGHNAHRFSIEWSRIEPAEGHWDFEAMSHYRAVIEALIERRLEPVVTLHHFTNPAWFSDRGGWLRKDSPKFFSRYAEHVMKQLGARVKYWITINEPTVYVMQGYINGEWPPFCKSACIKSVTAFKNLARAHIAAYRTLHELRRDIMVGFAHSAPLVMPCNPRQKRDCLAARVRDWILNRSFFYFLQPPFFGKLPRERLDFIGINYYTRTLIRGSGWGPSAILGRACHLPHHIDQGATSDTGWEIYPSGLQTVLERFSHWGIPLMVTENGVATDNEALRREFLLSHLESLAEALRKGVNVVGYLYWSLIDNFEWAMGTRPRFGLAAVDFWSQERKLRAFAEDYKRVCSENRLALVKECREMRVAAYS
ncbi:MAG TPA: glycoside hydrolase family 1 protein [Candidatus Binatia bacterium]|nr:glycoside hydrolase family 1 protein [Candidatus Binatia bacterium]